MTPQEKIDWIQAIEQKQELLQQELNGLHDKSIKALDISFHMLFLEIEKQVVVSQPVNKSLT